MIFSDRTNAGIQLARLLDQRLAGYADLDKVNDMVVIALPRGGVIVGLEVARKFGCPLDIIMSKKLPFPGQPELAIGAVSSDGLVVLNPQIHRHRDWQNYIQEQKRELLLKTKTMERRYYELSGCTQSSLQNKTVIIVDDGIATGMTALAALEAARRRGAKHTILAVPVISPESFDDLRAYCEELVALTIPREFRAVGMHYVNFEQTTDEEVIEALRQSTHFVRGLNSSEANNHQLPDKL
ncbi:MAG: phosphoribosyltransferase [Cyanobacteria bacterium]|nr:phosphoribosyltransferase [Cyanobacteriota bacterium]